MSEPKARTTIITERGLKVTVAQGQGMSAQLQIGVPGAEEVRFNLLVNDLRDLLEWVTDSKWNQAKEERIFRAAIDARDKILERAYFVLEKTPPEARSIRHDDVMLEIEQLTKLAKEKT